MRNLKKLLISLLFLAGCQTANIPNLEVCPVELPYSGDGYCRKVISKEVRDIPREKWIIERRTMVCMPHESYKMLKNEFYKYCYNTQCQQTLDSIGEVFQTLDDIVKPLTKVK